MSGLSAYRFPKLHLQLYRHSTFSHSTACRSWFSLQSDRRAFPAYLVSPTDLDESLKLSPSRAGLEARIIPLCVAWFPANDPKHRTGIGVFYKKRIVNARFLDLDKVFGSQSLRPHILPGAVEFAASMSELGIHKDDILIVYDTMERDILLAPRVGWMLKAFGHRHVHTLNNFRLWVEQGLPTAQGDICGFDHSNYPVPKIDEVELPSIEDVREATMNYNKDMEPRID